MDNADDPFFGRDLQVHRLCREDRDFAAIWEEYKELLALLRRLRDRRDPPAETIADTVRLRAELAEELTQLLDARFPP